VPDWRKPGPDFDLLFYRKIQAAHKANFLRGSQNISLYINGLWLVWQGYVGAIPGILKAGFSGITSSKSACLIP
jgi:hypothetical protein